MNVNVDVKDATLTVARSISDTPGKVEVKDTKTHPARRMAVDTLAIEVLRTQRAVADERAKKAGTVVGPDGFKGSQRVNVSLPYRLIRLSGLPRVTGPGARCWPVRGPGA